MDHADAPDASGMWLATTPPTVLQRRLTLTCMAVLLVAFVAAAPFARVPLPPSDGFIPYIQATMIVSELITAILLFTQFSSIRARSLLLLASGYLFTALIVAAHTLTFPGAFARDGLLGAGLQTTGWLHVIWHFVFPASVVAYALAKGDADAGPAVRLPVKTAVILSVVTVAFSVIALTWGLIVADEYVPRLILDTRTFAPLAVYTGWLDAAACATALLLLWARQSSVLDRWLMIAVFATLVEMVMLSFISQRFTLGWYAVRLFGFIASAAVLLALLTETTRLYAKLAETARALERERDNKLLNAQAATASLAHEIRQPLAAIAMNGAAARRFIQRAPPDLASADEALHGVVQACDRAADVVDGIRTLFGRGPPRRAPVDLNRTVSDVLKSMADELRAHSIETRVELASHLPTISGHQGQLREVVVNLVQNAIEAMRTTSGHDRTLRVKTESRDGGRVALSVADTGPGIDPKQMSRIFGAFITTKAHGTGLGLAISRMIIEQHGGHLTALPQGSGGAALEFVVPTQSAG